MYEIYTKTHDKQLFFEVWRVWRELEMVFGGCLEVGWMWIGARRLSVGEVAGFGRSGDPRGDIMRGVRGSGNGLWAGWGEVGRGYRRFGTLRLTAWSLPSKEGAGG